MWLDIVILSSAFLVIVSSRAYELTLKIVNVALAIKEVLLLITLNLNASQTLLGQVLRIVNIYDIVVLFLLPRNSCLIIHAILNIFTVGT